MTAADKRKRRDGGSRRSMITISLGLLISLGVLFLTFNQFSSQYRHNVEQESASHLAEITNQVKAYIEENMSYNFILAENIADCLNTFDLRDEANLRTLLTAVRDRWQVADIYVYTEGGESFSLNGGVKNNDTSSNLVYNARQSKRYLSILSSDVIYTVPVTSRIAYQGSRITALSIVQDMATLITSMDISSFAGTSSLFLTRENGIVIGQMHPAADGALYNAYTLFDNAQTVCVNAPDYVMDGDIPTGCAYTFLLSSSQQSLYVVSDTLSAGDSILRLFYCVPESIVNENNNQFVSSISVLTVSISVLFLVLCLMFFLSLYFNRRKEMDKELVIRDHMLDLLVTNTSNAFALLLLGQEKPQYISSNMEQITGLSSVRLARMEQGFQLSGEGKTDTSNMLRVNQQLALWNGSSEFISPYLGYTNGDGQQSYYILRVYAVEKENSTYILIVQDVTKEHEREQELNTALSMADSANQAKTRFLANMSHDIRTPMNAIVNMTDFALDALEDKTALTEYLTTTKESAAHLLELINHILDMSRIESGREYIESAPFELNECLSGVTKIIESACGKKGLHFTFDASEIKHARLLGDRLKLAQVLINLLNNAVKFTPPNGTVALTVTELASIKANTASIRFEVADSGMGIAKERLTAIFDPFVRVEEADVKQIEGNGLGLSICKSYVNAMGGRIYCTSQLGKGSRFTVELPFAIGEGAKTDQAPAKQAVSAGERPFEGKRALLCEDHPVNQKVATKIMERLGFAVEVANDGQAGYERFLTSPPGAYDVIYMDIQMPVMNGYEAAKAIRKSQHPQAATIPILAMTANVFAEDVEKARAAGMNGHIGKPLVVANLIEVTSKVIHKEEKESENA